MLRLSGRSYHAGFQRGFFHGQVNRRGKCRDADSNPPYGAVAAEKVVQNSAQPDPEEPADLVAEKDDTVKRTHVAESVDGSDQPGRKGHGRQPEKSHCQGEQYDRKRGYRKCNEQDSR